MRADYLELPARAQIRAVVEAQHLEEGSLQTESIEAAVEIGYQHWWCDGRSERMGSCRYIVRIHQAPHNPRCLQGRGRVFLILLH